MRILHSTHSTPDYIPPPRLASDEVVCGPRYPDRFDGSRVASLRTPAGDYDIAASVARLPDGQAPDLVAVRADSSAFNRPRNLRALRCPAVLIVGDTHHLPTPIGGLIDYALSEPFVAVVLDYTRQHAHFFVEAGVPNVYWLPGLNVRRVAMPAGIEPDIPLSFVGHVGKTHRRRTVLCRSLIAAGLPLEVTIASQNEARLIHARSRINLNCGLNGDLNLRVFEILQSGGFLLTDRLAREAGLDLLLEDGEHFVGYDSAEECIAVVRAVLADPARARRIARAGKAVYEERLAPERIAHDFLALLGRGEVRPEFDVGRDRRLALAGAASSPEMLRERIQAYEMMQQIHLCRESTRVLISAGVDPRLIADLSDLPRLTLAVDMSRAAEGIPWLSELLVKAGAAERVAILAREGDPDGARPDVVLGTAAEWRSGELRAATARHRRANLLLTSVTDEIAGELAAAGRRRFAAGVPLFEPASEQPA